MQPEDRMDTMRGSPQQLIVCAAAVVVILWGISRTQPVLVTLLVSVFLAALASPAVLWLHRRRLPLLAAVALVMGGVVLALVATGVVVGASMTGFQAALPRYQARFHEQAAALTQFLAAKGIAPSGDALLKYVDPGSLLNGAAGLLLRMGSALSNSVLVLLTTTFILLEVPSFPVKLRAVLGDPARVFPRFTAFLAGMKRYMVIKTVISLATGLLITLWLWVLDVDFPVLWGFLAFLMNYVPSIGSTLAGLPAVLLALLQFGTGKAVLVGAGYVAVNFVLDFAIETPWMGRKLGLSTLVVFLSLLFWGGLLGPIGALLCVPLSMTLRFALESSDSTRWVAVLLGPEDMQDLAPARSGRAHPGK